MPGMSDPILIRHCTKTALNLNTNKNDILICKNPIADWISNGI